MKNVFLISDDNRKELRWESSPAWGEVNKKTGAFHSGSFQLHSIFRILCVPSWFPAEGWELGKLIQHPFHGGIDFFRRLVLSGGDLGSQAGNSIRPNIAGLA